VTSTTTFSFWRASAGFFLAPMAWALHQQTSYMLVSVSCEQRAMILPVVTAGGIIITLLGGYISYDLWRILPAAPEERHIRTRKFVAGLSLLFTAVFLFAILLQGAAMFILNSCQR
jgi:hypothetical protein